MELSAASKEPEKPIWHSHSYKVQILIPHIPIIAVQRDD